MKKLTTYFLLLLVTLFSCQEEQVGLERPDKRLSKLLSGYKDQLTGSEHGWEAFLYPGLAGGYSFYMEFTPQGRVKMISDINPSTAVESFESSYQLKALQRPTLLFDTYSYIHVLSDPDPDTVGGVTGHGFFSDFEFSFVRSTEDTIVLKGNSNGSDFYMIRCSAQRAQAYKEAGIVSIFNASNYLVDKDHPYQYIQSTNGKKVAVMLNQSNKIFSIVYDNSGIYESQSQLYSYTSESLHFKEKMTIAPGHFNELLFDEATQKPFVQINGTKYDVKYSPDPLFPLHAFLGVGFTTLSLPNQVNSPGWSSSFRDMWSAMAYNFALYGISVQGLDMAFSKEESLMSIYVFIGYQGYTYLMLYPYSYTINTNGVLKFSTHGDPNFNGDYFKSFIAPILERIEQDRFKMEYLETVEGVMGKMQSIETASFSFAGKLN